MPDPGDANSSTREDLYFDDYESPEYKWGMIDTTGMLVIPAQYDALRDALEELIPANVGGKWGYIRPDGTTAIPHIYREISQFSRGRAFVRTFEDSTFLIDTSHAIISRFASIKHGQFTHDYCPISGNDAWGLIDRSGYMIMPDTLEKITVDDAGFLIMHHSGRTAILDTSGSIIRPYQEIRYWPESKGLRRFKTRGSQGFLHPDFTVAIAPAYDEASDFYYSMTMARKGDLYHLIGKSGAITSTFQYDRIEYIGEKFWKFLHQGQWGILDSMGFVVHHPGIPYLNRFSESYIAFGSENGWGFLDIRLDTFVPPVFPLVSDFNNGFARIITRNGIGFINRKGYWAIQPAYFEIRDFYNGLARVQVYN